MHNLWARKMSLLHDHASPGAASYANHGVFFQASSQVSIRNMGRLSSRTGRLNFDRVPRCETKAGTRKGDQCYICSFSYFYSYPSSLTETATEHQATAIQEWLGQLVTYQISMGKLDSNMPFTDAQEYYLAFALIKV
ncbi:hypothetical protein IG631_12655 [Alternaria alternata]|nr:hypothetical protein IG631_12655 [Alternaria alternata]